MPGDLIIQLWVSIIQLWTSKIQLWKLIFRLYGIWLLIHAQPQRALPLTLGRGWVISSRYFIESCLDLHAGFNSLRPRQNRRHFADDIFKCIFLNENVWIAIKISLKFVPKGPINNISALVQIMAWRRPGDKPLSEPMMVILPTQKCVTRPQWVN